MTVFRLSFQFQCHYTQTQPLYYYTVRYIVYQNKYNVHNTLSERRPVLLCNHSPGINHWSVREFYQRPPCA